jgi:heat shock protein HtpX
MAVHGFVTHAAANRRKLWWLVASYVITFELICAFALIVLLALYDPKNTILTNPAGYAVRYVVPVGVVAFLLFRLFYHGHLRHVQRKLAVKLITPTLVANDQEKRFLRIADQICMTAGVRQPQFGVIDAPEPNALAVGASLIRGLIVVTTGLLRELDDEELATVIAHEAAHIVNGDTQIMAANHALMRTAINLQVNNPLRMESWQQLLLVVMLPFFLPLLLGGSAVTMLAMQMSFQARRGISLTRDLIADGEAIRITHFPDALISALRKVAGKGEFRGSENFRLSLFCGNADADDVTHPSIESRIRAVTSLSAAMLDDNRIRRDTRDMAELTSHQTPAKRFSNRAQADAAPPPPMPGLMEILVQPKIWVEWHEQCVDYWQWHERDKRDFMGMTAKSYLPLAATVTFLLIFHWPSNGDYVGAIGIFNPANLVAGFETAEGGLEFFKYASAEASQKQGYLTGIIAIFFIIASATPGLREYVYPHVDWEKQKRKSSGNFWSKIMNGNDEPIRVLKYHARSDVDPARNGLGAPERSLPETPTISAPLQRSASRAGMAGIPVGGLLPSRNAERAAETNAESNSEPKPLVGRQMFNDAADLAKGEAVERLTGGWVTLGDDDDEDERPRRPQEKRETFNERLERELAKLSGQPTEPPPVDGAPKSFQERLEWQLANIAPQPKPPVDAQQSAIQPTPTLRPAPFQARPQGFGRKIA